MKKLTIHRRVYAAISSAIAGCFLMPTMAFAFVEPEGGADSLFYDAYDIIVNKLLSGFFGLAIIVLVIFYGGTQVVSGHYYRGLACVIAGSIMIKAKAIAVALGMLLI